MIRDFLITLNLPSWARWYAVDRNGDVWIYKSKPDLGFDAWGSIHDEYDVNCQRILKITDMTGFDWTQTLHEIERAE